MTPDEARIEAARRWYAMAEEAMESAGREKTLGPAAAVNRAYYACFYAASAVLLMEGQRFVKHAGVRSAFHRFLVKTGRVPADLGRQYDALMKARVGADYRAMERCTAEDASRAVQSAEIIVTALKQLLPPEARQR